MLLQDLRYGVRSLLRQPGFSSIAILTLALGIGANTAMFSLVDALIFRPIPVDNSGQLVRLFTSTKSASFDDLSYPEYLEYRDHNPALSGLVAYRRADLGMSVSRDDVPQLAGGMIVSGNFFEVLSIRPVVGRAFLHEEDRVPGRNNVIVISHSLWERRFASDRAVLGKTIRLNGHDFTIVGVLPARFTGLDMFYHPDLFLPVMMAGSVLPGTNDLLHDRSARQLAVLGRLKPGVSSQAASAAASIVAKRLAETYPDTSRNRNAFALEETEARRQTDPIDTLLAEILMALVGLVLLIAGANVANLLLSRAAGRSREIAIRLSIGASRVRLISQLLTESLLLAVAGGVVGLLIANWCISYFAAFQLPSDLPVNLSAQLDTRVLLYSLTISLATGILFGLAPAIQITNPDLAPVLKGASSPGGRLKRFSPRNLLVAGQVAVSLVPLVFAALAVKSFRSVGAYSPGFRSDHVLLASFDPSLARYSEAQSKKLYRTLLDRVRAQPGVVTASLAQVVPLGTEADAQSLVVEGFQLPPDQENISVRSNTVGPDYFDTMRIPIVRGRAFLQRDDEKASKVVIVNEKMAERYWPHQDAIGKRVRLENSKGPVAEVVGIARDGKYDFLAEPQQPFIYLPFAQDFHNHMTLHVLTTGDPESLAGPIRAEVHALDPNLPVFAVRTLHDHLDAKAVGAPRLLSQVVSAMGLLGLVLAVVGLYGVVAYATGRRTREIGIRMAIGADRRSVLTMVLRQAFALAATGALPGLILAFLLAARSPEFLVGVDPGDPWILAGVPVVLIAASLAACWVPARRASKIDPMVALRYE